MRTQARTLLYGCGNRGIKGRTWMRILLFTLEIIIYIGSYYLQGDQGEDSDEDIAAMLIR
jgi:hypothetical protein